MISYFSRAPSYSDLEISSFKQQAVQSAAKARAAAKRAGVEMHPRIAALKAGLV